MSRAALAFLAGTTLLGACKPAAAPPPSRDVPVTAVKATPTVIDTKPACEPEHEIGALDLDDAMLKPIKALCIRGVDPVQREDVVRALTSKVGKTLDEELLRFDVRSLYESGAYRRVDVFARAQDGGIELTFDLEQRPKN